MSVSEPSFTLLLALLNLPSPDWILPGWEKCPQCVCAFLPCDPRPSVSPPQCSAVGVVPFQNSLAAFAHPRITVPRIRVQVRDGCKQRAPQRSLDPVDYSRHHHLNLLRARALFWPVLY